MDLVLTRKIHLGGRLRKPQPNSDRLLWIASQSGQIQTWLSIHLPTSPPWKDEGVAKEFRIVRNRNIVVIIAPSCKYNDASTSLANMSLWLSYLTRIQKRPYCHVHQKRDSLYKSVVCTATKCTKPVQRNTSNKIWTLLWCYTEKINDVIRDAVKNYLADFFR